MPNFNIDAEGNLVEEGDPRGARVIYREGTEVDEATLESIKPGLTKELRARLRGGKPAEKEPAVPVEEKSRGSAEVEDKEGPRPQRKTS